MTYAHIHALDPDPDRLITSEESLETIRESIYEYQHIFGARSSNACLDFMVYAAQALNELDPNTTFQILQALQEAITGELTWEAFCVRMQDLRTELAVTHAYVTGERSPN
jgi:hypothetical protein